MASSETQELVPRPFISRPRTLWTSDGASTAHRGLLALAARITDVPAQRAMWQQIQAHAPMPWAEDGLAYAVCSGLCEDTGDLMPVPWPCPGVRPMLNALGEVPRA